MSVSVKKMSHYLGDHSWVLIIEPTKNYKNSIKGFLANLKVSRVKCVSTAQEAYRELLTTKVGFFIVEWDLPKENGLTFCRDLRRQNAYQKTPFLLLSVENLREDVVLASEALIDGYLIKPFSYEDFAESVQKIITAKENPSVTNELLDRANELLSKNEIPEAENIFHRVLAMHPHSARALAGLAAAANAKGQKNDAITLLQSAIKANPEFIEPYKVLIDVLADAGKFEELYETAKIVIEMSPGNPKYTLIAAKAALEINLLEESEKLFRQTIRISPKLAEAFKGLGTVNYINEDYESAMKHFKKSLDLDKGDVSVLNSLGMTYVRLGKIKEGIEMYRTALRIAPHEPRVLFNLGFAKEKIGDIEDAIFYYKRTLDYTPDHEKALRRLESLTGKENSGAA